MSANRTLEQDLESVCVAGPSEWALVVFRLVFNSLTVVLALCMIWFIAKRPALHANTFNVLFLSSFVVDILANLSRILLKYLPSMLCDHWLVRDFVGYGAPLATIINASEWYLSYATICCGFFFNFDHMILVVFPQYYAWMCTHFTKWTMFWLTWLVPLLWILPMVNRCCGSKFLGDTAATVFIDPTANLYDTVDMLLEAFFYVPIVFVFNCLTICVLQYRFRKCMKSRERPRAGVLNDLGRSGLLELPGVEWVRGARGDGDQPYLRIEVRAPSARRGSAVTQHRKIVDELDLSLINLIDQMIDAVGVLFYMFFWAGNNRWIETDIHFWMVLYDVCWELSTVTQPYIFLFVFPEIRREFFGFYSAISPLYLHHQRYDVQEAAVNGVASNGHVHT